jgi:hypothetical protein
MATKQKLNCNSCMNNTLVSIGWHFMQILKQLYNALVISIFLLVLYKYMKILSHYVTNTTQPFFN